MTQTLRRPCLAPPPALPATVHVEPLFAVDILHTAPGCARVTFEAATWAMRRTPVVWCGTCWPGTRCLVCGAPAGEWTECAECTADRIRVETDADRAAEYGED